MTLSEKGKSFLRVIGRSENRKGFRAEEAALEALLYHYPEEPWIKFPSKATLKEDTLMGVDIVVDTVDIGKLFLQIKSSEGGRKRFEKKKRRTKVAVVVITHHEEREYIWEKLRKKLQELRKEILEMRGGQE